MNIEVKKDPLYLALKSAGADEKQTHEAVARQLFINSDFATKDDLQKLETVLSGKIDKLKDVVNQVKDDVNKVKDDVHTIKVNEAKIVTRLDNIEKNQDRIFVEISDIRKDVTAIKVGQANL